VLDERQSVDLGTALIDQAHRKVRCDLTAKQARGLTDGAQQAFVTDAGQEILGHVDDLGYSPTQQDLQTRPRDAII
jgi:hypothetical protein